MKPPEGSRIADELAAIKQLRRKPGINRAATTSLGYRVQRWLWVVARLVAAIFLIGWLLRTR